MKTFTCRFSPDLACTVQVADERPPAGTSHVLAVEWTGTPTARTVRPYIAWMNSVNRQLADQWNASLLHLFLLGDGKTEAWAYTPGDRPRRVVAGLASASSRSPE